MEIGRPVYSDELLHYQVKGAKWGVRRWQYPDGSLTPEGRIHYGVGPARDTDPDLVDPAGKAKADVERLNKAGVAYREAEGRRYAREKELKKGRKWLSFESKKSWEARKKSLQDQIAKESADEKRYGDEMIAARDVAQARFEKYMQIADEMESDLNWIDKHMILETGETGSKKTYEDYDLIMDHWGALTDAVDEYWYNSGFVLHDRAMNANDEYRDKFEMNDSPRGVEAELNTTAKRALSTAKIPKNQDQFRNDLHKAIVNEKGLEGIKALSSIDTASLSSLYKIYFDNIRFSDSVREREKAKADKIADKIAKQIVPDEHNRVNIDPSSTSRSTQEIVAEYIKEKAMFGAAGDDEQILETLWSGTTYSNSDTLRDAREKMKKMA